MYSKAKKGVIFMLRDILSKIRGRSYKPVLKRPNNNVAITEQEYYNSKVARDLRNSLEQER